MRAAWVMNSVSILSIFLFVGLIVFAVQALLKFIRSKDREKERPKPGKEQPKKPEKERLKLGKEQPKETDKERPKPGKKERSKPKKGQPEPGKWLGQALRQRRISCNMTQEFVAEAMGVDRQTVLKWESGTEDPSVTDLLALARLFQILPQDLIRVTDWDGADGCDSRSHCQR